MFLVQETRGVRVICADSVIKFCEQLWISTHTGSKKLVQLVVQEVFGKLPKKDKENKIEMSDLAALAELMERHKA